eukprot:3920414-Prymnesium_polylepis.1
MCPPQASVRCVRVCLAPARGACGPSGKRAWLRQPCGTRPTRGRDRTAAARRWAALPAPPPKVLNVRARAGHERCVIEGRSRCERTGARVQRSPGAAAR